MPGTAWNHQDAMFPAPSSDHMIRTRYTLDVQHVTTGFQSVPFQSYEWKQSGLHVPLVLWATHLLHVSEQAHANGYRMFLPVPSVTQWFLPCQLLGNLSTDASGV
jgi:hypothetical protein